MNIKNIFVIVLLGFASLGGGAEADPVTSSAASLGRSASKAVSRTAITSNATLYFDYASWVEGRNCDLPHIQVTTKSAFPADSTVTAYLYSYGTDGNPDGALNCSARSVNAQNAGSSATSARCYGRDGGPYAGRRFTYNISIVINGKTYHWEFFGWDGNSWAGCNRHVPALIGFTAN